MRKFSNIMFCIASISLSNLANAAPSPGQVCNQMISEGRGNGQSQEDCLCYYRTADAVLDNDIKALLFDSWYHGTDNMQRVAELPRQGRVRRQFRSLQQEIRTNCQ